MYMTETILIPQVVFCSSTTTQFAGECTPTVANATDCAIVKSSIYVTVNTGHEEQARANALTLINHRLERGTYEQGTILHTSYLGPDLNKLSMIGSNGGQVSTLNGGSSSSSNSSSSSHPTLFYVAIGVVSLAAMALIAFLALAFKVHKERKRREAREVSSITGSANSGQSHRSSVMAVEDLHVSYGRPTGSSSRNSSAHFITPQSTPEDYDRRYLLGQRTQRF